MVHLPSLSTTGKGVIQLTHPPCLAENTGQLPVSIGSLQSCSLRLPLDPSWHLHACTLQVYVVSTGCVVLFVIKMIYLLGVTWSFLLQFELFASAQVLPFLLHGMHLRLLAMIFLLVFNRSLPLQRSDQWLVFVFSYLFSGQCTA